MSRAANRRDFLRACVAGALAMGAGSPPPAEELPRSTGRGRVALAQDAQLRIPATRAARLAPPFTGQVDPRRALALLDAAITALFALEDPRLIWTKLVRAGERIGIKVNTLGGRGLSSNAAVVDAICERLQEAGIRPPGIVIWDRSTTELERAGFPIRTGGNQVQCFGTDRVGYEDGFAQFGSVDTRISKIVTRYCDALINVPVLKDHDGAGVTIALKNMYGAICNPNKFHPDGCNPFIADVNMLPELRGKLRLVVCDATTASYHGGPAFKPEFTWQHNALIVARDPVALDTIGWQIIERKRAQHGLKTLAQEDRAPRYLATAADDRHRLGIGDPSRITFIETRLA